MLTIGFHSNQLGLRGTEVSLYDYANHNELILGNRSLIFYDESAMNTPKVIERFSRRFETVPYKSFSELKSLCANRNIDSVYMQKHGKRDGREIPGVTTIVHTVFPNSLSQLHGDRFAFISNWLSRLCSAGSLPVVPLIVELPTTSNNLRASLKISDEAIVYGCYGGENSFDIDWVKTCVKDALRQRKDLVFIFMNIKPFDNHERLIFLPGSADLNEKATFINTCDAMIHARFGGETFGLACSEFAFYHRPILTFLRSSQTAHIENLSEKILGYGCPKTLSTLLNTLTKIQLLNAHRIKFANPYSPARVMVHFNDIFLASDALSLADQLDAINFKHRLQIAKSMFLYRLQKKYLSKLLNSN